MAVSESVSVFFPFWTIVGWLIQKRMSWSISSAHFGTKLGHFETSNHLLSHELDSQWVRERMNKSSGVLEQSEQCRASDE